MRVGWGVRLGVLCAALVTVCLLVPPASGAAGDGSGRAGRKLWQVRLGTGTVVPESIDRRFVYVGVQDRPGHVQQLVALRRRDGAELWRVTNNGGSSAVRSGRIVVASTVGADGTSWLLLLDARSGHVRARVPGGYVCGVSAGRVVVATDMLRGYDLATGRLVWHAKFQPYTCLSTGRFLVGEKAPIDTRVFDIRTGRLLLRRTHGLVFATRPNGRLVVCERGADPNGNLDEIIGLEVSTGRERWRLPWNCDNDEGNSPSKVISTVPVRSVRLADSDTGRLLAETTLAAALPGWGVRDSFSLGFNGFGWVFTGMTGRCEGTTRGFGPSLFSPEVPGIGLALVNRTVLVTRRVSVSNGCRIVGVDAFDWHGRYLWSQSLADQYVGTEPLFDYLPYGTATTMVAGSTNGVVTAVAV